MPAKKTGVNALVFDVFGTVVDWRSSLIREGQSLGRRKRLKVDWAEFAAEWRAGYQPAMARVRSGPDGTGSVAATVLPPPGGVYDPDVAGDTRYSAELSFDRR